MPAKMTLTTGDVAKIFGVTINTVNTWIDSGVLVGRRIPGSKHRRVDRGDMARFAKTNDMPMDGLGGDSQVILVGAGGIVRNRITDALKRQGLRWLTASNAFDAGIKVAKHRPSTVVIDASIGRSHAISLGRSIEACGVTVISLANEDDAEIEGLVGVVLRKPVDTMILCRVARLKTMASNI